MDVRAGRLIGGLAAKYWWLGQVDEVAASEVAASEARVSRSIHASISTPWPSSVFFWQGKDSRGLVLCYVFSFFVFPPSNQR